MRSCREVLPLGTGHNRSRSASTGPAVVGSTPPPPSRTRWPQSGSVDVINDNYYHKHL